MNSQVKTEPTAQKKFSGVFTALVTPFLRESSLTPSIDWKGYEHLLRMQIKGGIQGIVPCGTTGESPTLTKAEKQKLIEKTVEICASAPSKPLVIAGTGSNNTADTVENSKLACSLGADALLVVVPYYNKPSQAGLNAHFQVVAEASTKPVFLYNVPGRTGISLSPATVAQLAQHPNIIGIKEASGNLALLTEMRRALQERDIRDFTFLTGDDPTFLPFISCGGDGVISVASNLIPSTFVQLWKLGMQRNPEALLLFESLIEFLNILFVEANPIPCKSLLAWSGHIEEMFRLPLVALAPENAQKVKNIWAKLPSEVRRELGQI